MPLASSSLICLKRSVASRSRASTRAVTAVVNSFSSSFRGFASRALGPAFKPEKPKPLLLDRTTDLPPLESPTTWHYIYREDDVKEIRTVLNDTTTGGLAYGVYGPPGVGKTTVLEKAMEETGYKCIVIDMQRYCHYNIDVFIDELNRTDVVIGRDPLSIASYCQTTELPLVLLHADLLRRSRWLNNSGRGEAFLSDLRTALGDKGVPLIMESDTLTKLELCDKSIVIDDPDTCLLADLYSKAIPYFDKLSPIIHGRLSHWKDVCDGGDLSSASRVANHCWMTFLAHPSIVDMRDKASLDNMFYINETIRYLVQLLGAEGSSLECVGPWERLIESNKLIGILVECGVLTLLPSTRTTIQDNGNFELIMSSGAMAHALRNWLEKSQPDLHWTDELRYIRHLLTRQKTIRDPLHHLPQIPVRAAG
ncbi:DNA mismatch repair protein [Perkinsus chesapeaki]|uniref:DNA mismatch repair protein n=1 Tax=Perkinsus chesapeaki TaxID=330153 RepID=A0A7J6MTR2_PERCH|nr:DNA mismatch repair protein [Perkinsus chesapeaki]